VGDLLIDARRWADRSFLVEGQRRFSFRDHETAVARVAAHLGGLGVAGGERVMLLAANRVEWIVAFWAVQSLGAVAVLGNAWWSDEEAAAAVALAAPRLLIDDRGGVAGAPALTLDRLREVMESAAAAELPTPAVAEDDPAIIMFSSGTTGAAKGVVMSQRAVVANTQNLLVLTGRLPDELDAAAAGTVSLLTVPLFHLAGLQIAFGTMLSGGSLVLLEGRFDPEAVLRLIERERVRVWGSVPTMVSRVVDHARFADFDTSSLRSIPMGGAAITPELRAKICAALPAIRKRVGSLYGLTEAGGLLAAGSGNDVEGRPNCVGRALPVVELRIADADAQGVGELLARTPAMTSGYWGDETPITDREGWLRTGDLGRIDGDGLLYIVGRSKDIVIRGGENVACAHVERCLLLHPAVLECAVLPLPHGDLGEEVAAVVVLKPGSATTREQLREHAVVHLGRFEVPTRWWLRHDALPTNAAGKVHKRELVEGWRDIEAA
jgi:long-chain acyl-CoA synthetase